MVAKVPPTHGATAGIADIPKNIKAIETPLASPCASALTARAAVDMMTPMGSGPKMTITNISQNAGPIIAVMATASPQAAMQIAASKVGRPVR